MVKDAGWRGFPGARRRGLAMAPRLARGGGLGVGAEGVRGGGSFRGRGQGLGAGPAGTPAGPHWVRFGRGKRFGFFGFGVALGSFGKAPRRARRRSNSSTARR